MSRVTLDDATLTKLLHFRQPLEVYNEAGELVGTVRPPADRFACPLSEAELQRLRDDTRPGMTTAQVLAHLE